MSHPYTLSNRIPAAPSKSAHFAQASPNKGCAAFLNRFSHLFQRSTRVWVSCVCATCMTAFAHPCEDTGAYSCAPSRCHFSVKGVRGARACFLFNCARRRHANHAYGKGHSMCRGRTSRNFEQTHTPTTHVVNALKYAK